MTSYIRLAEVWADEYGVRVLGDAATLAADSAEVVDTLGG
jgi:hypothetical protein